MSMQSSNPEEDEPVINLPFGLDKDSIAPSTFEILSKEGQPIETFVGKKRKSLYQKHLEENEQKKRRAESDAAEKMGALIDSFNVEKSTYGGQTFVRGATEGLPADAASSDDPAVGQLYQPKPMWKVEDKQAHHTSPPGSPTRAKGSRRAIDEIREEIARSQQHQGGRGSGNHMMHRGNRGNRDQSPEDSDQNNNNTSSNNPSRSLKLTESELMSSTNLYVSNISPVTKEAELYRLFGQFGAIASVKIMWPYSDEERSRGRNCGFVAFMDRVSAERAYAHLNGFPLNQFDLLVSWSKPVRLPLLPLPPPPIAPCNSATKEFVPVIIPKDKELIARISKLASFVSKKGPEFEQLILRKEMGNPDYLFLYQGHCAENLFYRWKIYSFSQGDDDDTWSTEPFQFPNTNNAHSNLWYQPPLPAHATSNSNHSSGSSSSNIGAPSVPPHTRSRSSPRSPPHHAHPPPIGASRTPTSDITEASSDNHRPLRGTSYDHTSSSSSSSNTNSTSDRNHSKSVKHTGPPHHHHHNTNRASEQLKGDIQRILSTLTISRQTILMAMGYVLEHSEHAHDICEIIVKSLVVPDTPISQKLARLFLCSDILWNSSNVPKGFVFRDIFQENLLEVLRSFHEAFKHIKGRISAMNCKERVMKVLNSWESWSLFPSAYIAELKAAFLSDSQGTTPSNVHAPRRDSLSSLIPSANSQPMREFFRDSQRHGPPVSSPSVSPPTSSNNTALPRSLLPSANSLAMREFFRDPQRHGPPVSLPSPSSVSTPSPVNSAAPTFNLYDDLDGIPLQPTTSNTTRSVPHPHHQKNNTNQIRNDVKMQEEEDDLDGVPIPLNATDEDDLFG